MHNTIGSNIAALPMDVWLAICAFLRVRDLAALCGTAQFFRSLMDERSVWHIALSNHLSRKPLPNLEDAMPSMSAAELRDSAIRVTRVASAFSGKCASASLLSKVQIKRVMRAQLLPGGERYVTVANDGEVSVRSINGVLPLDVVPGLDARSVISDMRVAHRSLDESVVLEFMRRRDVDHEWTNESVLRIFRLSNVLRLVTKVNTPPSMPVMDYCVDSRHFAYAWWCPDMTCMLSVRNIPDSLRDDHGTNLQVQLLGPGLPTGRRPQVSLNLLGPKHIVVVTLTSLFLFELPLSDAPLTQPDVPENVPSISPTWITDFTKQDIPKGLEYSPPRAGPASLSEGRGRFGVCTGSYLHLIDVTLSPQTDSQPHISTSIINDNPVGQSDLFIGFSNGLQPRDYDLPSFRPFSFSFSSGNAAQGDLATSDLPGGTLAPMQMLAEGLAHCPARQLSVDEYSGRVGILYNTTSRRYAQEDSIFRTFSTVT